MTADENGCCARARAAHAQLSFQRTDDDGDGDDCPQWMGTTGAHVQGESERIICINLYNISSERMCAHMQQTANGAWRRTDGRAGGRHGNGSRETSVARCRHAAAAAAAAATRRDACAFGQTYAGDGTRLAHFSNARVVCMCVCAQCLYILCIRTHIHTHMRPMSMHADARA